MIDKDNCPAPILPKNLRAATFMDIDEVRRSLRYFGVLFISVQLEIARQLTMEEYDIYAEIKPEELQELAWSKESLKHKAPNVLRMIARFNHISMAFATLIVNETRIKQRKKMLEKLISVIEVKFTFLRPVSSVYLFLYLEIRNNE